MKLFFLSILFIGSYHITHAQNAMLSIQDAVLKGRSSLAPKRLQNLQFSPNGTYFLYTENQAAFIFDAQTAKPVSKFDITHCNTQLKKQALTDTLNQFVFKGWANDSAILVNTSTGLKEISFYSARHYTKAAVPNHEHLESFDDSDTYAYVKNHNIYVHVAGAESQVTTDGSYTVENGISVHRDEFGIHKGLFFSPKGNLLAYYRMDQSDVSDYPIIDWSKYPAENQNIKYPMAGNASHYVTLHIYNLKTHQTIQIKTTGPRDQYLTNISWSPDEQHVYIAVVNRAQNQYQLNSYNSITGDFEQQVLQERDEKYTEPQHPMYFVPGKSNQFVWLSRKDGFLHAYLYTTSGTLIRQLSKGPWEIKSVLGFDPKGACFYIHANKEKAINQDVYAITLSNGALKRLTQGDGFHVGTLNAQATALMDQWSACYVPRQYDIINLKTNKHQILFTAEHPTQSYALGSWNIFTIPNAEGTPLYARLFKPVGFDSTKKYPVIVYLYNGPHSQMVTNSWMAGGELWYQYMAQRGYIVFTIDGRGTSYRGKAFEQAIHRQLGTVEMEDQMAGIKYLKQLPYVDPDRLAVHGWSFGGFMTTSLMSRYPGVFKVGVCGGPVIDWSYYEIMYGERYMDTPQENPEGYKANNLLNHVKSLKGKLLMIHGAQDNVVVLQHSMMYLKKAVDEGVQIDFYAYPGHEHNVLGKDRAHLMEKVCDYIMKHL